MVLPRLPKQVADKARSFACEVYKLQPKALIPNAADDLLRYVWDNVCDPFSNPQEPPLPGLPFPPAKPFTGGQCCDKSYKIVTRTVWADGRPSTDYELPAVYQGKILGLSKTRVMSGSSPAIQTILSWQKCDGRVLTEVVGQDNIPETFSTSILRVFLAYGGTDNCGDPPKTYPPAPPPPSPNGYVSPPTPIVLNDNDTLNVSFNFVPPALTPPSSRLPDIKINVDGVNFRIPITFEFNGNINIGAPTPPPPPPPPDFKELEDDFKGLNDKIDSISNKSDNTGDKIDKFYRDFSFNFDPPPFPDSPEVEKVDNPPDDEGEKQVEDLLGVVVTLTKRPDKAQFGSPTCYFAGWLTFLNQGGYEPRYQINFETGYFPAPLGCTGYAYTFTNGAEGAIREYRKVREE